MATIDPTSKKSFTSFAKFPHPGIYEIRGNGALNDYVNGAIELNRECQPHNTDDYPGMNPSTNKLYISLILGFANIILFRMVCMWWRRLANLKIENEKQCKECNVNSMIEITSAITGMIISWISIILYMKFKRWMPTKVLMISTVLSIIIVVMHAKDIAEIFFNSK